MDRKDLEINISLLKTKQIHEPLTKAEEERLIEYLKEHAELMKKEIFDKRSSK